VTAASAQTVRVGVACFVLRGHAVLVLRRDGAHQPGTYGLPGGKMEWGESAEQTAYRETREETGLVIGNPRRLGFTSDYMPDDNLHYVTLFMQGQYQGGEPQVLEPAKCPWVGWVQLSGLQDLPLFSPLANFCRDYNLFEALRLA
jgi:8-oxo-dGTP diphosphatase